MVITHELVIKGGQFDPATAWRRSAFESHGVEEFPGIRPKLPIRWKTGRLV